jgi:phosphoribosylanthranilate isomerase
VVKVKICGIKKREDALLAVRSGADAVGLLVGQVHTSNDFIDKDKARDIVDSLPPFCSSVLVTHLTECDEICDLAEYIGVSTIQLHGDSSPAQAKEIKQRLPYIKTYKAIHVTGPGSVDDALAYRAVVDGILLDTVNVNTGQVGGTGMTHDWSISSQIVRALDIPVIMAGGLNPENVQGAVARVHPYGVDVNSGTLNSNPKRTTPT